jgi:hypothetical protein
VNYIVQKTSSSTREPRDIACIVGVPVVALQTAESNCAAAIKKPAAIGRKRHCFFQHPARWRL